jgi:hypothetical protein
MKIMNRKLWKVFAGLCVLAMSAVWVLPVSAQMSEVKEKPPMYSYVAFWTLPRSQWAEMAKSNIANAKILDKAMANGTLVGYGDDENLIHGGDAPTHDGWWSAMSMAGVLNVLDQFYKAGNPTSPVLASATNHWDNIYVSRYYNWHSGTWKDLYTHGSLYKLRPDAPSDAVDLLSKNLIAPLMEKLLADGTIHEYEIDTEAVHTQSPGAFWVFYLAANADSLDKVDAAIRDTLKAGPLSGPAFSSVTDSSEHRDYLVRASATYK